MGSDAGDIKEAEPTPSQAGLWEDFVDIFYAPSQVFARRSRGNPGLAMLFLVIAATILFFLTKNAMQPIMDAEFARQSAAAMRKNPNVTAEQLATGRHFFEMLGPLFVAIGLTFSILFTGLILWLVGKLFDAKESVTAAIMVATYAEVPRLVQGLVNAAQALFMSPDKLNAINSVGLNLARFMDPDRASPIAIAVASRVDVFTIWVTVLLAIGIHVVGKIPKQQAAIVAAIVWVAGGLPAVLGALRGS
ncbi:MAG: Yip1 family protein [Gemmatimonadaceae bacterium]